MLDKKCLNVAKRVAGLSGLSKSSSTNITINMGDITINIGDIAAREIKEKFPFSIEDHLTLQMHKTDFTDTTDCKEMSR